MGTKGKIETIRKGPRMALEKVRRSRLHCLSSVSIIVCFLVFFEFHFVLVV